MKIEDIETGMDVLVKYNDYWRVAHVTGVSKKTGFVTVWIGDYVRIKLHCSQLKEVEAKK